MIELDNFKKWMEENTSYSPAVISDQASRMKRADKILPWSEEETYQYYLEKQDAFVEMSVSVRSQMRKAVKLYAAYTKAIADMKTN